MKKDTIKENKLEELLISDEEAQSLDLLNEHEYRLLKLEKTIKGNWGSGYKAGLGAELNNVITLAEDRENEFTFTDFIWYLKERRKKLK